MKTILTLDFETYFDANYTLTKLSNTEYIRHALFKVHGVGIKFNYQRRTLWLSGEEIARRFARFDWTNIQLLCHHTHFDALILLHHYGYKPAYYLDTLSMSRPVHGGGITNRLNDVAEYYGLGNKIPDVLA